LGHFLENVPNWDVFEKTSISAEVRVSADSYDLGDQGLGAGLFVRRRRGGEIVENRLLNFGGPIVK
jgi:hypothetical protein